MFGGGSGFRLFSFRGIPVEFDVFALFLIAYYAFTIGNTYGLVVGIAVSVGIFVSILIHEMSHALVGTGVGARVTGIRLHIMGGATFFSYKPPSYLKDMLISLSGPAANFALWKIFEFASDQILQNQLLANTGNQTSRDLFFIFYYLSQANFFLGVFNILPGFPLDGGQALYALLMGVTKRPLLSATVIMVTGCIAAAGIVWYFTGGLNFSAGLNLSLLFALYIAYWIASSSIALYNQTRRPTKPTPTPRQQAELQQRQSEERAKTHPGQRAFEQGRAALLDKDYAQALANFNSSIESEPKELSYLDYRAYTYTLLGEYSRALLDYTVLVERLPNRADFFTARAQVYKNLGNIAAARADLEQALQINPTESLALQLRQELAAIPQ